MSLDEHPALSGRDKDGAKRSGRVFTMRLEPKDEATLRARMAESRKGDGYGLSYYGRSGSLGAFIIAAALKWSEPKTPAPPVVPASSPHRPALMAAATAAQTEWKKSLRPRGKPAFPKPKRKKKPVTLRSLNRRYGKRIKAAAKKKPGRR